MQCCACAQVVASGDVGGVIKIWNVLDGVCTRTFGALTSHRPPIADLQWHPEQPELIAVMCAPRAGLALAAELAARIRSVWQRASVHVRCGPHWQVHAERACRVERGERRTAVAV